MPVIKATLGAVLEENSKIVALETPPAIPTPAPKETETVAVAPVETGVADLKPQFTPIFAAYYGLKDALVADNSKLAAEKAKILKKTLQNMETQNWTNEQRNVFDSKSKKMDTEVQYIANNANKIEAQRDHLENLSKNLFEIAKALKESASVSNVVISGFTDRLGSDKYNLALSEKRASAVRDYLVNSGIAASRLNAIGNGESNPVVTCTNKKRVDLIKCLEPNRRVEVEQMTFERRVN